MNRSTRCLLGLLMLTTLGCVHVGPHAGPGRARLRRAVAEPTASTPTAIAERNGIVDLSEPPRVVDDVSSSGERHRESRARGLDLGTLLVAAEVASWVPPDHSGPSVQIELRNNCSSSFDYSFAASMLPTIDAGQPRRTLDGHTLALQRIAAGQWLHLWDGERWVGSAMTTVDEGRMDISPSCDVLEVNVNLRGRGPTNFAIHWELDADESLGSESSAASEATLVVEEQDQPEPWGPSDAEARVELRLANLCAETISYAFASDFATAPERTASLPARTERRVEIPAGWWLRYQALNEEWRGGATTSLDGGIAWITADCLDFGVADRQTGPESNPP